MMRRLGGSGAALAGMAALVVAFVGQSTMIGGPGGRWASLGLIVLFGTGAIVLATRSRNALGEMRWGRGLTPVATGDSATRPPASSWRVAGALGRVEARELVFSPWFAVAVVLCTFFVVIMGGVFRGDGVDRSWGDYFHLFPGMAHALVGLVVIATHRAATRAVRDGADELFDSCPASATVRTFGFLRTAWVPVAAIVVFMAATLALASQLNEGLYGSVGWHDAGYAVAALVLGIGGVALGVALAQWWRWGLAGVVIVVAVGFASGRLGSIGQQRWSSVRELATWTPFPPYSAIFTDQPVWWHAGWLIGLVGIVVVVAVAAHDRSRALIAAGAGSIVVAVTCGVVATQPLSPAAATRIADLIAKPTSHDICTPARSDGKVLVCVYRQYPDFGELVAREVTPVASALPAGVPAIRFQQVFDGEVTSLPTEVARLLPHGAASASPALNFSHNGLIGDRQLVAFAAVGLSTDTRHERKPYVAAGQARGVVAVWLATRGLSSDDARKVATGRDASNGNPGEGPPDAFDRGYAWQGGICGGAPVVWSGQDLLAARQLLALPERDVLRVLHAGWDRWTSPSTSTDDLLAALGRPSVGPFDQFASRVDATC
jgi:hypothetical protein